MAKIMVVDDAAFLRAMLRDILVKAGHEVVFEAQNGREAVDKYKAVRPDLVTMDITMPVMEGVEAVKEIRKFDPAANIVMCSAMGQKNLIIEAIQSGAKDFIVKPFQSNRVLEAISKAIE
ncbi:response regulator [Cohnella boryungensis]|jgi:two-component system chemotaxis response regulator CheY|uniref:Response regulator n=1 Tax=Cohnella boryungensis TaxID=768479 RepID=A0ABV8S3W9_9BACL